MAKKETEPKAEKKKVQKTKAPVKDEPAAEGAKGKKASKPKKEKAEKKPKVVREGGKKGGKLKPLIILGVLVLVLALVGILLAKVIMGKKEPKEPDTSASSSEMSSEGTDSSSAEEGASEGSSSGENPSGEASEDGAASDGAPAPDGAPTPDGAAAEPVAPSEPSEPAKPFEFSMETFNLPIFNYAGGTALENMVHRDITAYFNELDDRPGVNITALVVPATVEMPDGTTRALAYVWSSRYAVADNMLFDYGSMVGPCALNYAGGKLQSIELAQGGDKYEESLNALCGGREDIAQYFSRQAYDFELRGQMLRNVKTYIAQNNLDVQYFRTGDITYKADGTFYSDPSVEKLLSKTAGKPNLTQDSVASQEDVASSEPATPGAEAENKTGVDEKLEEDYQYYQNLPQ